MMLKKFVRFFRPKGASKRAKQAPTSQNRRPIVVLQCGDCLENRERILPLALTLRDAGWDPVVLVDTLAKGAGPFLMHDMAVVAILELAVPSTYQPDTLVPLSALCPLDLRKAYDDGRSIKLKKQREVLRRYWYAMACIEPDMVIPWNGYTGFAANALRCYKDHFKLPGGYTERGLAPLSVFFDEDGVNGGARLAKISDHLTASTDITFSAHLQPIAEYIQRTQSLRQKKTIFVPLQVEDDSNIVFFSQEINTMRSLVKYALRLKEQLGEDWKIVVRPHPEEVVKARLNLPKSPNIEVDATTPLHECIASAGVCLTINSTVGLEAALQGSLTICLGDGIYCRQPFVVQAQAKPAEEVAIEVMQRLEKADLQTAEKLGYLKKLQEEHQIGYLDGTTARTRARQWSKLAQSVSRSKRERSKPRSTGKPDIVVRSKDFVECYQRLKRLRKEQHLDVDLVLASGNRLFLTYRKTAERLTLGYLRMLVEKRGLSVQSMEQVEAAKRPEARLAVASSNIDKVPSGYDAVIDEYGYPHVNTYLSPSERK